MSTTDFWDSSEKIGEVQKNDRAKYVIEACVKGDRHFANVREWYLSKNDNDWHPGKAGICIPVEDDIARACLIAMCIASGMTVEDLMEVIKQ